MTNREFFIKTLESETPIFLRVIQAVPTDKSEYKPHDKARTAGNLVMQLAMQPTMVCGVVNKGLLDFSVPYADETKSMSEFVGLAAGNWEQMKKDVMALSDEEWDNGSAAMVWPGGKWEAKKYDMSWGLLFDAIHHRGQLSTYIRAFGGVVPSIYGGSADQPV